MAVAMAASGCGVGQFRESSVFRRGDVEMRGLARRGVGFADRSHESFYASRVRCGKKQKSLALKVAKVQELVKVQRDLVLSSQQSGRGAPDSSIQRGVSDRMQRDLVLSSQSVRGAPESSVQMGVSDPGLDHIMKNLEDLQMELESIIVKAKKKKGSASSSSSSSSSSVSSDGDTGKADTKSGMGKKKKNGSLSSSSSSSSFSSDNDMGEATDTQDFPEENNANQIGTSVVLSAADKPVSIIPRAPVETFFNAKAPGVVMASTFSVIATLLVAATFVSAWFPVSGMAIRDHLRSLEGLCGALNRGGNYGDNAAAAHCITNGAMLPTVLPTEFPGVQPMKKVWQHPRWIVLNSRSRLPLRSYQ